MKNEILNINDLTTHFFMNDGVLQAVDELNLVMKKNQTVGLVGESGSGKSVTALSIMGLVPSPGKVVNGSIHFKGNDLLKTTEDEMRTIRGSHISMVFQDPFTFLNPLMKTKDQIAEMIKTHQSRTHLSGKKEIEERVVQLLNQMKIPSAEQVKDYYPHQLSGGMRQRVVLAIALACKPDMIILDEPTTALDVTTQMQLITLLNDLKKTEDLSILLITHDLGIVAELCDVVYIMYAGHILEYGNINDIFDNPKHPYTLGLLDTLFSIDEFKQTIKYIDGGIPYMIDPPTGCRFNPRCSSVMEICKKKTSEFVKVGEGHFTKCWLYS